MLNKRFVVGLFVLCFSATVCVYVYNDMVKYQAVREAYGGIITFANRERREKWDKDWKAGHWASEFLTELGIGDKNHKYKAISVVSGNPQNIKPIVEILHQKLGSDWEINLIGFRDNLDWLESQVPDYVRVIHFPFKQEMFSLGAYNTLCQIPSFWESIGGEYVLIFQSDSSLCSHARFNITHYLGYSYVGAPWMHWPEGAGNGGFSLRHIPTMIRLLGNRKPTVLEEDTLFATLLAKDSESTIPDLETRKSFCVESMFYDRPFAYHAAFKIFKSGDKLRDRLNEYCPELLWFLDW